MEEGEGGKVRRYKYFGAGVVRNMKSVGFDVGLVINGNRFFKEQSLRNETDRYSHCYIREHLLPVSSR